MKDVIEQIIEVDSLAFENSKKNEQLLLSKRQEYEKTIADYRSERVEAAKKNAQLIAEETNAFILDNEKSQIKEIQKISAVLEQNYKQVEKDLIEKIFKKLFVLEG